MSNTISQKPNWPPVRDSVSTLVTNSQSFSDTLILFEYIDPTVSSYLVSISRFPPLVSVAIMKVR